MSEEIRKEKTMFNLSKCQKNANGELVAQTRDGRSVRILCTDRSGNGNVIGLVDYSDHEQIKCWFSSSGRREGYKSESGNDLMNIPVRHEGWVNVYFGLDQCLNFGYIVNTKEIADEAASGRGRIACIHVEFKEGEGLDQP